MRRGGILGGIVIALAVAPGALAQEPLDPVRAAETVARGAGPNEPAREAAKLKLRLKHERRGEVDVGDRLGIVGKVFPFVRGQRARVLVSQNGKSMKRTTVRIRKSGKRGNVGRFSLATKKLVKPKRYRVLARKLPSPAQKGASRESRVVRVRYPNLSPGDRNSDVKLLNRLLAKQAYYTKGGKRYGSATGRAVLAFRKVNNLSRAPNLTAANFKQLAAGKGGFKLKWPEGGKHIETDLSRQVMVLARGGKARHIFHISSGAPATRTVRGKFPTYRKDYGYNSKQMLHSVYFIRGYATHGYHSVPTYPASHGCLRNPIPNAKFIYDWTDIGDVFYVYG